VNPEVEKESEEVVEMAAVAADEVSASQDAAAVEEETTEKMVSWF
jgi:hypothetical protein